MFTAKSPHLDFLIDACERIGRSLPEIGKFAVGTVLLSRLNAVLPLPLLRNVGMFSPIVMADIADGTRHCLETYARQLPAPLACANLCLSNHDQRLAGVVLDDRCCERVLAKCLQSGGEVVNGLVQEWPAAQLRRSVG